MTSTPIDKVQSLRDVELDEVSVVDNPANQFSLMALFKRAKHQGDDDMDVTELTKRLEDTEAKVETLTKRAEDAEASVAKSDSRFEALIKALKDADITVEEKDDAFTVAKAEEPEYIQIDGEPVLKSEVPAPLLKRLESQQAKIDELVAKGEKAELAKRAEQMFPNLGGTPAEKSELVKMLDSLEGDAKAALEKSLKAADAAISKMFDELGGTTAEDSDVKKQLNALVEKYASEKSVTKSVAFAEVTKSGEGRKLLVESRNSAN